MKKLFLSLAVVFSVAMISCGGGDKAAGDSTVVEENVEVVNPGEEGQQAPDENATENTNTEANTDSANQPAEQPAANN